MKHLNTKLLGITAAILFVTLVGTWGLHKFQRARNAEAYISRADVLRQEGDLVRAMGLYRMYLKTRPRDAKAAITYAEIANEYLTKIRQEKGDVGPQEVSPVYSAIEAAILLNKYDIGLLKIAADFNWSFGPAADALERYELLIDLMEKSGQTVPPDYRRRLVTLIGALVPENEAIGKIGGFVGFDPKVREFTSETAPESAFHDAYLALAMKLVSLSDTRSARIVVDRMVTLNPDDYEAYLRRVDFLERLNDSEDDLAQINADLEKALELAPEESDVVLRMTRHLLQQKQLGRVKSLLDSLIIRSPEDPEAYALLSQWAAMSNDQDQAREYAQKGLELNPNHRQLLWLVANFALDKKDYDELARIKTRFMDLRLDRVFKASVIHYFDAREAMAKENWVAASKSLEESRPGFSQYMEDLLPLVDQNLAECYDKLGQHDRREEAFTKILDKDPMNEPALWGRVDARLAMNQQDAAIEDYRKLLAINDDISQIATPYLMKYLNMELVMQNQKPEGQRSWARAESIVKRVGSLENVSEAVKLTVALEYFKAIGDEAKAEQVRKAIGKRDPLNMSVVLDDIMATAKTDVDAAIAKLDKVSTEVSNQGEPLPLRLIRLDLMALKGPSLYDATARRMEQEAASLDTKQRAVLLERIARQRMALKNYPEAKRLWTEAATISSRQFEIYEQLFDLALAVGDEAGMQDVRDKFVALVGEGSPEVTYIDGARAVWEVANDKADAEGLPQLRLKVQDAIGKRSKWDRLYLLLAEIDLKLENPAAAKQSLTSVLKYGPDRPNVLRKLAEIEYADGNYQQSELLLAKIDDSLLTDKDRRMKLDIQARTGNLPDELPIDKATAEPAELIWLSQLTYNAGRLQEAEELALSAVKGAPSLPASWQNLVRVLAALGKVDDARKAIERAELEVAEQDVPRLLGACYEIVGEFEEAERSYRAFLDANPDSPDALRLLATLYTSTGRFDDARLYLDRLLENSDGEIKLDRTSLWARRTKATILASSRNFADFTKALELIDMNTPAGDVIGTDDLLLWGRLSANRTDEHSHARAVTRFEGVARERSLTEAEQLLLAELYEKQGRWADCKSLMQSLLAKSPRDLRLLSPWLDWLMLHDDLAEAQRWLRNCPENSIVAILTRAQLLVRNGRTDDAKQLISKLMPAPGQKLTPENLPVLLQVSKLLEMLAKFDKSLLDPSEQILREYVKYVPHQALELALLLGRRGETARINEALDICQTFFDKGQRRAALSATNVILYANRATLGANSPIHDRVRKWFDAAFEQDPDDPQLMVQRADFENAVENYAGVEQWLRKYLDSPNADPTGKAGAQNNLAYLLALRGEGEESMKLIEAAIQQTGPVAEMRDTRAAVLIARKEYDQAIEDINKAMEEAGETAGRHFRRAIAESLKGDTAAAQESMKRSIDKGFDPKQLNPLEMQFLENLRKAIGLNGDLTSS